MPSNPRVLSREQLCNGINRQLVGRVEAVDSPQWVVLDMGSTEIPVYGQQEKFDQARPLRAAAGGRETVPWGARRAGSGGQKAPDRSIEPVAEGTLGGSTPSCADQAPDAVCFWRSNPG